MLGVLEDAVLERGLEVLKAARSHPGQASGRAETAVGWGKRYGECLGDPFGKFAGDIALFEGRIIAGLETVDGRQRHLIVDAGIVNAERDRKHAIADDFVGGAFG